MSTTFTNKNTESEKKRVAKVVLLGDTSTGKTSLLHRFMNDEFCDFILPSSTIGASISNRSVYVKEVNADVEFEIWDTAGQERYHSLASLYYRNADAAIILYDITDARSFDGAKLWIEEVEEEARPKPFIILVGNKSDLESQRSVPRSRAESYASQNCVHAFMEASAKTGRDVHEIFYRVAKGLYGIKRKYFKNVVLATPRCGPRLSCCR